MIVILVAGGVVLGVLVLMVVLAALMPSRRRYGARLAETIRRENDGQ